MPGIQPGLHLETRWTARFILAVLFLDAHWDASERAIPGPCRVVSVELSRMLVAQSLWCCAQVVSFTDRQQLECMAHRSDKGRGTPVPTLDLPGRRRTGFSC